MRYDLMFFSIGFALEDSYRICSFESNNLCRKFSRRIQILHKSFTNPMNQRSPYLGYDAVYLLFGTLARNSA
jgi:hypothetical protein